MRSLKLIGLSAAAASLIVGCVNQSNDFYVVEETYLHKYGVELPPDDWMARGQNGQVVCMLANGVTVTKTYVNGMLHGDTIYTFPHSSVPEKKVSYANNRLIKETLFYRSGTPKEQVSFLPEESKEIVKWYENGVPESVERMEKDRLVEGEYYNMQHEDEGFVEAGEGSRVCHDSFGQILYCDTIEEGNVVLRTTYYPNGSPKEKISYVHGEIHGLYKRFHPAGEPDSIEEWQAGKQQGMTVVFQNGEKFAEVPYQNGLKSGVERRFRDGTQIAEEITWRDGVKHGPSISYIGKTPTTQWYYQGKPVTKGNFDILIRSL
jgi:antitoxin component YwqK of YwqJK toxin-antitoxin module